MRDILNGIKMIGEIFNFLILLICRMKKEYKKNIYRQNPKIKVQNIIIKVKMRVVMKRSLLIQRKCSIENIN